MQNAYRQRVSVSEYLLLLVLVHFSVLLLLSVGVIFSRFTFQLLRLKLRLHISLFSPYLPLSLLYLPPSLSLLCFFGFLLPALAFSPTLLWVITGRNRRKKHRAHTAPE